MKDLRKHYWIPTSTWNLPDIFVSESISPFSFYTKRLFGSKSNQIVDDKGRQIEVDNFIALYPENFRFEPGLGKAAFILINSNCLDTEFLEIDENEIAYYKKTIYLRRGNFQIRFFSAEDRKFFLATLSINLETKTLKKYNVQFNFSSRKQEILHVQLPLASYNFNLNAGINNLSNNEQIYFDKSFNQIKGFIYGIICSTVGRKNNNQISLEKNLQSLKSKISGFRTRLELSNDFSNDTVNALIENVTAVENSYSTVFSDTTTSIFQSINQRLKEVGELQMLRLVTLSKQRQKCENIGNSEILHLKEYLQELQEEDFNLKSVEEEILRQKEGLNSEFKSVKRPKKDSAEYEQKSSIKERIGMLKERIGEIKDERRSVKEKIQHCKLKLNEYSDFGKTQYDSNIEEQFYKILGYINDLIFSTNEQISEIQQSVKKRPDLSQIKIDLQSLANSFGEESPTSVENNFILSLQSEIFTFTSDEEKYLFKEILNIVLSESNFSTDISESCITRIAERVLMKFAKSDFSATEIGQEIVLHLQNLIIFRTSKEVGYSFPDSIPVLQNFIAFIIKPYGNDELKNFIYSKGINDLLFAYSIWATYIGFANLPKTFTDIVFESGDDQLIDYIDDYLFSTYLAAN